LRRPVERELGAAIGVVDDAGWRLASGDGHCERVDDELALEVVPH
jgi:hypothetical protein